MVTFIPLENGNQRAMLALAAFFAVLPTCVVTLRTWTRRISNQWLRWSDYWIIVNNAVLVAFWLLYILIILAGGIGRPFEFQSPLTESDKFIGRCEVALDLLFSFSTLLLKLSTLSLLRELFGTNPTVHTVLRTLTYLTAICGTVAVMMTLVLNVPTDRINQPDVVQSDDDFRKEIINQYFNYAYTMVLDFAILAVPIWRLYPLKMEIRKKVGVMIAFGLGFG
ncbi:Integral membrane protein [Apiospora sp. TS-2023a]